MNPSVSWLVFRARTRFPRAELGVRADHHRTAYGRSSPAVVASSTQLPYQKPPYSEPSTRKCKPKAPGHSTP
ncbi:hypothetical protein [Streptomyces sp. NPDC004135]